MTNNLLNINKFKGFTLLVDALYREMKGTFCYAFAKNRERKGTACAVNLGKGKST
jgi:hypothetical protein